MMAAMAVMAAALSLRPALGQTAPAQPAPATARVIDPATTLRSPTSTQAERDEAARRLVQRRTAPARDALLAALQDAANRPAQTAAARALAADPNPDPAFVSALFALIGGGS